jgi:hypothetical protein
MEERGSINKPSNVINVMNSTDSIKELIKSELSNLKENNGLDCLKKEKYFNQKCDWENSR